MTRPEMSVVKSCRCFSHEHHKGGPICGAPVTTGGTHCVDCRNEHQTPAPIPQAEPFYMCDACRMSLVLGSGVLRCQHCRALICVHLLDRDKSVKPWRVWCRLCPNEIVEKVRA